jgi:holo-[acyl-carrier protein] synthase
VIVGIGIDVVGVVRVAAVLGRHGDRFLRRVLTEQERRYCSARSVPEQSVAARLAAKEAAFKALGGAAQARGVGWRDIEVATRSGRPTLLFHGIAAECLRELGVSRCWLSLTHSHEVAVAVVVLEDG